MSDFEFIPNKNNLDNLDELSLEASRISEKRICELYEISELSSELVVQMLDGGFGIYEALSLVSSGLSEQELKIHERHLPENFQMLASYVKAFSLYDKAVFSTLLYRGLARRGIRLNEADFFEKEERSPIIAFVKNLLASEAYDVFSEELSEPRLRYVADLKEAVSLVVKDEVGYAILPLEEKGGSRLSSITEMLFKSDLKINSVTPVFGALGNADMKYALVSPTISVPTYEDGDDRYLELRLSAENTLRFTELISVADYLGITLYRVNTISFSTEDGILPYFSLVLKTEARDFTELLIYLTLFVEDFTSVGIYKNLE